jgi:hypothetical protein
LSKERLDIHATTSDKKGLMGALETFIRSFRGFAFAAVMAPIGLLYILCMGISLTPGIILYEWVSVWSMESHFLIRSLGLGFSLAISFFLYGFSLILIIPLVNKLLPFKVSPQRSTWYSLNVIPWYYHNGLIYLARYTFLDIITPTPLNLLFYRLMGMKIGKGSIINTSNVSDACLIEIGDYVTIGGSATLIAHYGMKGMLIIDRLQIKNNATIGLRASLFGDVVIGEGAVIKPHEVVLPKTRVPDLIKDA